MKTIHRLGLLSALAAASFSLLAALPASDAHHSALSGCASGTDSGKPGVLRVVGLTSDQRLICFNDNQPAAARTLGSVSGLVTDTALVGIDFRVQDGKLYGVGNAGGVYVLDTATAMATLVNRLSVALSGGSFGVDFNPAADRLRIISDTGQNLRHDLAGATLADDALDYPAPGLNIPGPSALGVVGAAYTNNDLDALTGTTLLVIDANLDQVALQAPPNNGSLGAAGKLTIDTGAGVGFDIYSKLAAGTTVSLKALASLTASDGSVGLYAVNVPTGKAALIGQFAASNTVTDIAIPLGQQ